MPLSFGDTPLLRPLPVFTVLSMVLSSRTVFCATSEFACAGGNVRGEGGRDGGFGLGDSGGALSKGLITFGEGALALAAASLVARGFGGVRTKVEGGGDLVLGGGGGAFVEVGKICFWTGEVCGDLVSGGAAVGGGTGAGGGAKESLLGGGGAIVVGGGATGALGGDG